MNHEYLCATTIISVTLVFDYFIFKLTKENNYPDNLKIVLSILFSDNVCYKANIDEHRKNPYNIIKHYQDYFIQLVIFEMNTNKNSFTQFVSRTELLFAVPLPEILKFMLGYCQYLVLLDFGYRQKQIQSKKQYEKKLSSMFVNSLKSMNSSQRASFYFQLTQNIFRLIRGDMQPPAIENYLEKKECYFKNSTYKSWRKCLIEHNSKNHFLSLADCRTKKTVQKYYINLSQYLLRGSKNKDYFVFNLDAWDKRVSKNMRNIKIGFEQEGQFQKVFSVIRDSINFTQFQKIAQLYSSDPLTKNCINSINNREQSQFLNTQNPQIEKEEEEVFYSCCEFSDEDQRSDIGRNDQNSKQFEGAQMKQQNGKYSQIQVKGTTKPWSIKQKLVQINSLNKFDSLIENQQIQLSKNKDGILFLSIILKHNLEITDLYNYFQQKCNNHIDKCKSQGQGRILMYFNKLTETSKPRIFSIKRKIVKFDKNQIILHEYPTNYGFNDVEDGYICGEFQALWVLNNNESTTTMKVVLNVDNKGQLNREQNLKMNINYMKGVYERFILLQPKKTSQTRQFFNRKNIKICSKQGEFQIMKLSKDSKYSMSPLIKGLHEKIIKMEPENILSQDWKRDEDKGGLQFINDLKIAAQKGVLKHILSQIGKNLFSGKSILNISLPVEIFSPESHLERILHSLRLAPFLFQQVSSLQNKQNISELQLSEIIKLSAAFGISMSLLYLSQEKSFNPILGETSQMWIDGCPAYAEQISHHPPISAIYFVGRGYKIYGQLEAKVELGMNSGRGSNDGQLTIEFQNGITVRNYFASGEVSGLSYGKRKFIMTGKSHHFIDSHGLYLEIDFNPKTEEIKSVNEKQKHLKDHLIGKLFKIPLSQIAYFKKARKFKNSSQLKIFDESSKFQGRWTKEINSGQKILLNTYSHKLDFISHDQHPLPSDSIWRQDIYYRLIQDLPQSQKHKVILEEKQRKDKKLRTESVQIN